MNNVYKRLLIYIVINDSQGCLFVSACKWTEVVRGVQEVVEEDYYTSSSNVLDSGGVRLGMLPGYASVFVEMIVMSIL